MSNQVLIVAAETAARIPAEVARSLQFRAVVVPTEAEALALLDAEPFRLIAVGDDPAWQRVRDAAETKQPMARVLRLPGSSDDISIRQLLTRYLDPLSSHPLHNFPEERYRFLSKVLESFTATLEVHEVVRRIVTLAREEFDADRAWLLRPITDQTEFAKIAFAVVAPHILDPGDLQAPAPLVRSLGLVRRALVSAEPLMVVEGDPDLDPELAERYQIRSAIITILRPREGEPWALGLHQSSYPRQWTREESALLTELGRYATLALNNALLHASALREMAKANAILDQIPESAAIYGAEGRLERMNNAAQREASQLFASDPEVILRQGQQRYLDGRPLSEAELPSVRAIRGEVVKSDYLVRDARSGDDRVVNLKAAPIRNDQNHIIGALVLARDVTEERQNAERESLRRRRAECLANLGLETITLQPSFDDLNEAARRIADAIAGSAMIYLYSPASSELHMVGMGSVAPTASSVKAFHDYLAQYPYRPGEGVPGTVFQIGRPLFFSDIRGTGILDFARADEDREIIAAMQEQSLIACPIESYGDRIGALVIARSDRRRDLDADDLEFAQAVADRIGAAAHINWLTRVSQEGHRAAEELARREVDARVRFEAVLEAAPVGMAVISADELRFELANARFLEFAATFGRISLDTRVIGLRIEEVLPGFGRIVQVVADSGETHFEQAWRVTSGVNERYVNRIVSAVRGRFSGITQSITILIQDVTEQVRARHEIEALADMMAERSARLDSILASMTDGLWLYNANAQVIDVNQAALTMFGLGSRTEAVDLGSFASFAIRYPDGKAVPTEDLPHARALRGETVPDYLAIGRHLITGKDLDLSIAAAPIESGGIVGAVIVIRDITALQELDRKKDEFLSVASHELRTPLTTIKGYTQLLAQTINDLPPEERNTYLTAVLGEIDRMMGLISELLDVSRIETNRLQIHQQPIRWIDFLGRRASAFRVQNPARQIRFDARVTEITVHADPDRMRQVIDNLLSNALKYSPEGTEVELTAIVDGGSVLTTVTDRGIGIPRDEIPQLFERFHRARNVSSRYYGGLGLGLYIAKAIIEAHNGTITVESEEGEGSRFTIRLPLA